MVLVPSSVAFCYEEILAEHLPKPSFVASRGEHPPKPSSVATGGELACGLVRTKSHQHKDLCGGSIIKN